MPATSSEDRTGSAGRRRLCRHEQAEPVERTGYGPYRAGRHLGVEGGVLQLGVAEQRRNDADIDAVLQQVRGKAVAQRVRADAWRSRPPCAASATTRWSCLVEIGLSGAGWGAAIV